MEPKKIYLWTAPRCVSTAFERSIMNIEKSKILHEPFSKCYYFGSEKQTNRYNNIDKSATYSDITTLVGKEYHGVDFIFCKDMAYAIRNHFDILLRDEFRLFQHTFLIRNPQKTIPSLYRASINKQLTGWDYFEEEDAGFVELYDLFNFVNVNIDLNPLIIDAEDLLSYPVETMKAYCEATGLKFKESILKWEPGPIPEWDTWNGWHDNALKSSGFCEQTSKEDSKSKDTGKLPKEVQNCIQKCMPYYKFLHARRCIPSIASIE